MVAKEASSVAAKLCAVMEKATYVQKKGRNKEQGYNYAQEADFLELVKPLLADAGVIVLPKYGFVDVHEGQTRSGTPTCRVTLSLELTFMDAASGTSLTVTTFGQGVDTQDKAAYKAMTGAMKYALSKTLLIPTGDDPEGSDIEEGEKKPPATKATEVTKGEKPPAPAQAPAPVKKEAVNVEKWLTAVAAERKRMGDFQFFYVLEKSFGLSKKEEPEFTAMLLALSDNQKRAMYAALVNQPVAGE